MMLTSRHFCSLLYFLSLSPQLTDRADQVSPDSDDERVECMQRVEYKIARSAADGREKRERKSNERFEHWRATTWFALKLTKDWHGRGERCRVTLDVVSRTRVGCIARR